LENEIIGIKGAQSGAAEEEADGERLCNAEAAEPETAGDAERESERESAKLIKHSIAVTERECSAVRRKYENAMDHVKEMEQHSAMLHDQINELRSICIDQTNTISALKKKINAEHCDLKEHNALRSQLQTVQALYSQKVAEIEQCRFKTEVAVSSLQTLQSKLMVTLDVDDDGGGGTGDDCDGDGDDERKVKRIGKILKNAQAITTKLALNEQTIKSLNAKVASLEVSLLKSDRKLTDLQTEHFRAQRARRILEANYQCIYSKTVHKVSTKYLSEIDSLRNANEDLYDFLSAEQRKTKELYDEMVGHRTLIESLKVKVEDLNDLLAQFQAKGGGSEQRQYLKTWQSKCTNLEIKEIELLNQNDSLLNEVNFLRSENKKFVANIGSLQKKLSLSVQELQNAKQEVIRRDTTTIEDLKELVAETESKSVQTAAANPSKMEADDVMAEGPTPTIDSLKSKIAALQHQILGLQSGSQDAEHRVKSATEGLQLMLNTAKDTIANLQSLMSQKNESIEQYKKMMDKLLKKLKEQQSKYSQHIAALKRKYEADQQQNDQMVLSEIQKMERHHGGGSRWVAVSEMESTIKEKEDAIAALRQSNEELAKEGEHSEAKINILNTRIDEYHDVIQQLNAKIKSLSEALSALKNKLSSKKKETVNLQKAVLSMKSDLESTANLQNGRGADDEDRGHDTGQEMDDKMRRMENEYKILRCSLKSEVDDSRGRLTESEAAARDLERKNKALAAERDSLREAMDSKSEAVHRLQVQLSRLQKDKIAVQEKHSLSLRMSRKKVADLERRLETATKELSASQLSDAQSRDLFKFRAQCSNLKKSLSEKSKKIQAMRSEVAALRERDSEMQQNAAKLLSDKKAATETVSRLQLEVRSLRKKKECKPSKQEMDESDPAECVGTESATDWRAKWEAAQCQIRDLRKVIEIEQSKEIRTLRLENQAMKRKHDLLSGQSEDRSISDKQIAKLLDEIEAKSKGVIDLEIKVNELEFEREALDLKHRKMQKEVARRSPPPDDAPGTVIASRSDPELQNLLDSMRFIITKLKKENQSLRSGSKPGGSESVRIGNLLKENRNLKRRVTELSEVGQHRGDSHLSTEIDQKRVEIERISKLNRRLSKEVANLKESNEALKRKDSFKNDEVAHLRKMVESERESAKRQTEETNMVWKRKMSLSNDDLSRYKKIKKQLETELEHKKEINEKMSTEIKALIELIDHSKKVNSEQTENDKLVADKLNAELASLKQENEALRSELSAFDVDFFNEIEDLKYREAQAQRTIVELQSQLQTQTAPI